MRLPAPLTDRLSRVRSPAIYRYVRNRSTETAYHRQKHPFLSPPGTAVPTERFHEILQDTLRGPDLGSLPFYDQKKVVAVLDRLPEMSDSDRMGVGSGVDVDTQRVCY